MSGGRTRWAEDWSGIEPRTSRPNSMPSAAQSRAFITARSARSLTCVQTRQGHRRHATSHNHTFVSVTSLFIAYRAVSLSASIFCRRRIISPFLSLRIITADGVSERGKVTLPETFIRAHSIILNVSSFSFVIYIIMVFEHLRRQQINLKD